MSKELANNHFKKLMDLKNLLENHSTNGKASNIEYKNLRRELLSNQDIHNYLPKCLKDYRDLDSFWRFIKNKFKTYKERREFLTEEFKDALIYFEFPKNEQNSNIKNKVFIVHGHDNEIKQEVARFIENIGLEVVILHEQANSGMTIIEKIEFHTNEIGFAIILYTPCDKGRGAEETKIEARNRARQNVVFEHGYLIAKLGRKNVCGLVKGKIELPSDIDGVVYIDFDLSGAWKYRVLKEIKNCGYTVYENH